MISIILSYMPFSDSSKERTISFPMLLTSLYGSGPSAAVSFCKLSAIIYFKSFFVKINIPQAVVSAMQMTEYTGSRYRWMKIPEI